MSLCTVVPGGCSAFVSQQASAFKYLLCIFPVSARVSLLCAHLVDCHYRRDWFGIGGFIVAKLS